MAKSFKKFSKTIFGGTVVMSTVFSNAGTVVNAMEASPPAMSSNFLETDAFKIFLENVDENKIKDWEGKDCWKDFSEKEGTSVNALKSKSLKSLVALYALAQRHLDKKDKVYKKAIALKKDLEKVFSDSNNMKSKILDFFAEASEAELNKLITKLIEKENYYVFFDFTEATCERVLQETKKRCNEVLRKSGKEELRDLCEPYSREEALRRGMSIPAQSLGFVPYFVEKEQHLKEAVCVTNDSYCKPLLGIHKMAQSMMAASLTYFINNSREIRASFNEADALEVFKNLLLCYDRILHFESDYTYRSSDKEGFDQKSWEIKIINVFGEFKERLNDNVITEIVEKLCSARKNECSFCNVRGLCDKLRLGYKKELERLKERFKGERSHQAEGTTMFSWSLSYRMNKIY